MKDKRNPLSTRGIYSLPGSCEKMYIETEKSVVTRIKKNTRDAAALDKLTDLLLHAL